MKRLLTVALLFLTIGIPGFSLTEKEIFQKYSQCVVKIKTETGTGTGFFVNQFGTLLTCSHVVSSQKEIWIEYQNKKYFGLIVADYKDLDQALVQILFEKDKPFPYVKFAKNPDSYQIDKLDSVISMGFPLGANDLNVNVGKISAKYISDNKNKMPIYQSDVVINPGNSGGPCFDLEGNVIGIATSKVDTEKIKNVSGMNFINSVNNIASNLLARPFLQSDFLNRTGTKDAYRIETYSDLFVDAIQFNKIFLKSEEVPKFIMYDWVGLSEEQYPICDYEKTINRFFMGNLIEQLYPLCSSSGKERAYYFMQRLATDYLGFEGSSTRYGNLIQEIK